jgi:plastocyanin
VNATTGLAFTPATVNIAVGDSVTWVFDAVAHTVSFQQGAGNTGEYGGEVSTGTPPSDIGATANASVSRKFLSAGTYHYRCSIHPAMLGTVQVN